MVSEPGSQRAWTHKVGIMSGVTEDARNEERGRDTQPPVHGGKRTRGASKSRGDDVAAMEGRLVLVENALTSMGTSAVLASFGIDKKRAQGLSKHFIPLAFGRGFGPYK